ncbi:hypothetical protein MKS88_002416 [Plasmodium brasilianum]|uniref:Trophozoite stage antigen n=2 Tax=Plasmodium (Plasmodium) TaxID=418103 RepID=A0A1A8X8I5_PLAMA|nr:trophozoite stage antigen, putative [Plasmodium malariae]KAI4838905.1 hypothetical protein MKS88_002416 [Plasmodium brasilianum]SBT00913.1 trophozoite stage antigen [Plasmodium malariae]SBT79286.1 trophozoite stage antigen, putative [Plasmodium malariae]SCN12249.1 trophozoite stage antigen, putative [Plasmodium malariae]
MDYHNGDSLTKLYKSNYMNDKEINARKEYRRSRRSSLKSEIPTQSFYDSNKRSTVDPTMTDYHFEIFTSLNDKIRPHEKKKIINKAVNTDILKHEHNKFCATITIKCKECNEKLTREFEL